jgi:hypothetical protein
VGELVNLVGGGWVVNLIVNCNWVNLGELVKLGRLWVGGGGGWVVG